MYSFISHPKCEGSINGNQSHRDALNYKYLILPGVSFDLPADPNISGYVLLVIGCMAAIALGVLACMFGML
jgi:hypothetical protein